MTETTTTETTPTPAYEELTGHDSPETAYVVDDYPYGFRLRTTIRFWIETKKGQGQRTMSQTRDPKRAGQPWNKPKGSTYSPIRVLLLDTSNGHIEHHALSAYDQDEDKIAGFREMFPKTCAEPRNARVIEMMIARARAWKRVTYTVTAQHQESPEVLTRNREVCGFCTELQKTTPGHWCEAHQDTPRRQSPAEQAEILRKLTLIELKKLRGEA
jgi:hypothetical protein